MISGDDCDCDYVCMYVCMYRPRDALFPELTAANAAALGSVEPSLRRVYRMLPWVPDMC